MRDSCDSLQLTAQCSLNFLPCKWLSVSLAPTDVNKSSTLDGLVLGLYISYSSPFRMLHTITHSQFQQKNANNKNWPQAKDIICIISKYRIGIKRCKYSDPVLLQNLFDANSLRADCGMYVHAICWAHTPRWKKLKPHRCYTCWKSSEHTMSFWEKKNEPRVIPQLVTWYRSNTKPELPNVLQNLHQADFSDGNNLFLVSECE